MVEVLKPAPPRLKASKEQYRANLTVQGSLNAAEWNKIWYKLNLGMQMTCVERRRCSPMKYKRSRHAKDVRLTRNGGAISNYVVS